MGLILYNLLLLLLWPLVLLLLFWRLHKGKEDRAHWGERWGRYSEDIPQHPGTPRFWVHAVSVGEVMASIPILRELRRRYPDAFILLSTTTIGGREVAQKQIPTADSVVYYPIDFPFTVGKALDTVRPSVILLMEWEIWPNFLAAARRRGIPIAVLNGRISDKGLSRGLKARLFTAPGLAAVDLFAMQSDEDSRRAVQVGVEPAKVHTLGNTKFDESVTPLTDVERAALRVELGIPPHVPVFLAGSTRDDEDPNLPTEEALIGQAGASVLAAFPDLFLLLAPRHLERADAAQAALEAAGWRVRRRSAEKEGTIPRPTEFLPGTALLLDTFGELGSAYAVADIAFVGGSLVRRGGQSVFQPLAQGVPALFGPYMNNQRDIAALAKAEGIGFEVLNADECASEVLRLLRLPEAERTAILDKALELMARNRGVAARTVDAVIELIKEPARRI